MSLPTDSRAAARAAGGRKRLFVAGALSNLASLIGFVGGLCLVIFPLGEVIGDSAILWLPAIPVALILSYVARRVVLAVVIRA